jgi:hypothetical protein
MSSLYNKPLEEMFVKLEAGITGEIEPLRRLGVITAKDTAEDWAYTHGLIKKGEVLEGTNLILARYGLIMQNTWASQKDLDRTWQQPANQIRLFGERVTQLEADIGTKLLPIIPKALNVFKPFVEELEQMVKTGEIEDWGRTIIAWFDKVTYSVKSFINYIVGNWGKVTFTIKTFIAAWAFTSVASGLVTTIQLIKDLRAMIIALNATKFSGAIATLLGVGSAGATLGIAAGVAALGTAAYYAGKKLRDLISYTKDDEANDKRAGQSKLGTLLASSSIDFGKVNPPSKPISQDEINKKLKSLGISTDNGSGDKDSNGSSKASQAVKDVFDELNKSLKLAEAQETLLGNAFDLNSAKASALQSAMVKLLEGGMSPHEKAIESLATKLKKVNAAIDAEKFAEDIKKIEDDYNKSIKLAEVTKRLDPSFDLVGAKATALKNKLDGYLGKGLDDTSAKVKNATKEIEKMNAKLLETQRATVKADYATEWRRATAINKLMPDNNKFDADNLTALENKLEGLIDNYLSNPKSNNIAADKAIVEAADSVLKAREQVKANDEAKSKDDSLKELDKAYKENLATAKKLSELFGTSYDYEEEYISILNTYIRGILAAGKDTSSVKDLFASLSSRTKDRLFSQSFLILVSGSRR